MQMKNQQPRDSMKKQLESEAVEEMAEAAGGVDVRSRGSEAVLSGEGLPSAVGPEGRDGDHLRGGSQVAMLPKMELDSQTMQSTQLAKREVAEQRLVQAQYASRSPDDHEDAGLAELRTNWKGVSVQRSVHQEAQSHLLPGHDNVARGQRALEDGGDRDEVQQEPFQQAKLGTRAAEDEQRQGKEFKTATRGAFDDLEARDGQQQVRHGHEGAAERTSRGQDYAAQVPQEQGEDVGAQLQTFRVVMEPDQVPRPNPEDDDGAGVTEPDSAFADAHGGTGQSSLKISRNNDRQPRSGVQHKSGQSSQCSRRSNADIGHVFQSKAARPRQVRGMPAHGGPAGAGAPNSWQPGQNDGRSGSLTPAGIGEQAALQAAGAAHSSEEVGQAPGVDIIHLVQLNEAPRVDRRHADSHSTPNQIESPKLQHVRHISAKEPATKDTFKAIKKKEQRSQFKGLGLLVKKQPSQWEKQFPTPPKSGLVEGLQQAQRIVPTFKAKDASPCLTTKSQNLAELAQPQQRHHSSESKTWNVDPDTQHSMEQIQNALQESANHMERVLAQAGHVRMDFGTLMSGYSIFLAHDAKITHDPNKQYQAYQSQFNSFLNFKQDLLQRNYKEKLESSSPGEAARRFGQTVPVALFGTRQDAGQRSGSRSLEPGGPTIQLFDQIGVSTDALSTSKTNQDTVLDADGQLAKIQRAKANLEQAPLPKYPKISKFTKGSSNQTRRTARRRSNWQRGTHQAQAQGHQQMPKEVRLSDFAGCLKDKDLEIISKITNADSLKALNMQNKNMLAHVAPLSMKSGTTPGSPAQAFRRGAAYASKTSYSVAPDEREMLYDISNAAMMQEQILRQMQANEQASSGFHAASPKKKNTPVAGGPGAYAALHSVNKQGPLPNMKMINKDADIGSPTDAQPKPDKKFVVQVPQTNLTESHLSRKTALHQPVLPSTTSRRTEGRKDPGLQVNNKFAEQAANKNSHSPHDTLKLQNTATSPNIPKNRTKRHSNFDETMLSCTTPNSHDTQYAPQFLSKVQSNGSDVQQKSIKQSKKSRAAEKHAVVQNITIDRILSSNDTYTDKYHVQVVQNGGKYQDKFGNSPGARSKGTLSRDALKMTRNDMSLDKAESRTNFSGQSFTRQQFLHLGRHPNSEQRASDLHIVDTVKVFANQKSQKNSLLEPSQSFGTAKQDRSPLKNERIAKLSQHTSTKSLHQVDRQSSPHNFDKKILERSQENSQESNERHNDEDALRRNSEFAILDRQGERNQEGMSLIGSPAPRGHANKRSERVGGHAEVAQQPETPSRSRLQPEPVPSLKHDQDAQEALNINEGCGLNISVHATAVISQPAGGAVRTVKPSPKNALRTMGDTVKSRIQPHSGSEQKQPIEQGADRPMEAPVPDSGKFKDVQGLPFSLDLLPTLDVITISPQNAGRPSHPEQLEVDGSFDKVGLMGYRVGLPNADFSGHCHGPILSSRGGIMSEEASDKKTCEIRSNKQALEMPRTSDGNIVSQGQLQSQRKVRVERRATAGPALRKGRDPRRHLRYYQLQVVGQSEEPALNDHQVIKYSGPERSPRGQNQTTIAVDDPEPATFLRTGQPLYSLSNFRRGTRGGSKEGQQLVQAELLRRTGKSTPRAQGRYTAIAHASQAEWAKDPLSRQMPESEKQEVRLERYRQRKNHVELERLRRARMTQNRCLQRQMVQEKNKSLRIETELGYPAPIFKSHGPALLLEPREKQLQHTQLKAKELTPLGTQRLQLLGCPLGNFPLTATGNHEYVKPRGFLPQPPKSGKLRQLQHQEPASPRELVLQERSSARRAPKVDTGHGQELMISPQITYQKIVPSAADNDHSHAPLHQPALRVKVAQQPVLDRGRPDTMRRTGTLDICAQDELLC